MINGTGRRAAAGFFERVFIGRKKFIIDIEKVKELFYSGQCVDNISKKMQVSRTVIDRIIKENNLKRPYVLFNFWERVQKSDTDSCWVWIGGKNGKGYGQFSLNRNIYFAHRFSYALKFGEIPKGLEVCHKCDNPSCCNPEHLFLGTHKENMIDCVLKGRNKSVKLNPDKIREVRSMRLQGKRYKEIAEYFNISEKSIRDIADGKKWKHVI